MGYTGERGRRVNVTEWTERRELVTDLTDLTVRGLRVTRYVCGECPCRRACNRDDTPSRVVAHMSRLESPPRFAAVIL